MFVSKNFFYEASKIDWSNLFCKITKTSNSVMGQQGSNPELFFLTQDIDF